MNVLITHVAIQALRLDAVISDLRDPVKGPGWSLERAEAACEQYQLFLQRHLDHPEDDTNPTMDVDQVWHFHVLRTRQYHADCNAIFGFYLHHQPDKPVPSELHATCGVGQHATCGVGEYATCGVGQYATCGVCPAHATV